MEGLCKAWVLSKELFTLLQEFVCKMYASQTPLCKVNDLRYQLFRVKKGDVDSSQLPPCQDTICFMLCGLIIRHAYGKGVKNKKRTPQAKRDMDG